MVSKYFLRPHQPDTKKLEVFYDLSNKVRELYLELSDSQRIECYNTLRR